MQVTKAGGNAGFFVARHAREGGHSHSRPRESGDPYAVQNLRTAVLAAFLGSGRNRN
jgi:hypothetical protein